jgi:hypothetical protein
MMSLSQKLRQHSQQVQYMIVAGVDHFGIVEKLQQEDFVLTRTVAEFVKGGTGSLLAL